jgi:hypothetical protein
MSISSKTKRIFFDVESTGIDVYSSEIITGYFLCEDGSDYNFQSQVNNWSYEAELVHKITYDEHLAYPAKSAAFDRLLDWLYSLGADTFELVIYTNPNTMQGHINFDRAILEMELMNYLNLNSYHSLPFKFKSFSVYTLAKECAKLGYFTPIRGASGRESFTQVNVYKALFDGLEYDAHCAFDDVISMKKIYDKLTYLKENNIKQASQRELF